MRARPPTRKGWPSGRWSIARAPRPSSRYGRLHLDGVAALGNASRPWAAAPRGSGGASQIRTVRPKRAEASRRPPGPDATLITRFRVTGEVWGVRSVSRRRAPRRDQTCRAAHSVLLRSIARSAISRRIRGGDILGIGESMDRLADPVRPAWRPRRGCPGRWWRPAGCRRGERRCRGPMTWGRPGASTSWPEFTSQSRVTPSWPPDATRRPSGLNATRRTNPMCPRIRCNGRPVSTSQKRTVPSQLAVASRRPSGLKARASIASV